MKYIVETIGIHRHVHVIEADTKEKALAASEIADDNWQEYLGQVKVDISEYTEEHIKHFREKEYWWDGVAYLTDDGTIDYERPENNF